MTVSVLGIDLGKNICSIVGLEACGAVILRRRAKRETLIGLAAKLSPCIVAMEACCGAHYLGRIFAAHGHDVRLMSPEYVRPYVKAPKNDDRDAPNHAVCRVEKPRAARHADAASLARALGCGTDRSDQPVARNLVGTRHRHSQGQAQARTISRRLAG